MDFEVATWIAELIQQAMTQIEHSPGLTIEVEGDPTKWLQIIPEAQSEENHNISGFTINLPYHEENEPLGVLHRTGVSLPPSTRLTAWEAGSHATLWIRPDIPLIALALLAGELLYKAGNAPAEAEVNIQIEYGF